MKHFKNQYYLILIFLCICLLLYFLVLRYQQYTKTESFSDPFYLAVNIPKGMQTIKKLSELIIEDDFYTIRIMRARAKTDIRMPFGNSNDSMLCMAKTVDYIPVAIKDGKEVFDIGGELYTERIDRPGMICNKMQIFTGKYPRQDGIFIRGSFKIQNPTTVLQKQYATTLLKTLASLQDLLPIELQENKERTISLEEMQLSVQIPTEMKLQKVSTTEASFYDGIYHILIVRHKLIKEPVCEEIIEVKNNIIKEHRLVGIVNNYKAVYEKDGIYKSKRGLVEGKICEDMQIFSEQGRKDEGLRVRGFFLDESKRTPALSQKYQEVVDHLLFSIQSINTQENPTAQAPLKR